MRKFLFFENTILRYGAIMSFECDINPEANNDLNAEVFCVIKPEYLNNKVAEPFIAMIRLFENLPISQQIDFVENNRSKLQIEKLVYASMNRCVIELAADSTEPSEWFRIIRENAVLQSAVGESKVGTPIKTGLSADKLREHFLILTKKVPGSNPLLAVEDLDYWLNADFHGFQVPEEHRVIKILGNAKAFSRIRKFVYDFCVEHNLNKNEFCLMLQRRFKPGTSLKTIVAHFADQVKQPSYLKTN